MATITITTPSDKDARIADAFDGTFPGRDDVGLSKAQWVKRQLIEYTKQVVRNYEAEIAASAARTTTETDVNSFNIT